MRPACRSAFGPATVAAIAASLGCSSSDHRETELPVAPDAGGTTCPPGLPGPELVFIPAGAAAFCIDSHEVKQREYVQFLDAVALAPPAQASECQWNDRFDPIPVYADGREQPELFPGSCLAGRFEPANLPEYSMRCADWCDAKAYCEWAGKRLCGGLGTLEETLETAADPSVSEWQYACTGGGLFPYPYGMEYVAGKCIDQNFPQTDPFYGSPGSAQCVGSTPPFDRIADLAGNVVEWTSACDPVGRNCSTQGGSYGDAQASCAYRGASNIDSTQSAVGFRCCADAI